MRGSVGWVGRSGSGGWLDLPIDGGARSWSIIASVIQSAKLNDLKRMVEGHPTNRIDELLSWNYASPLAEAA